MDCKFADFSANRRKFNPKLDVGVSRGNFAADETLIHDFHPSNFGRKDNLGKLRSYDPVCKELLWARHRQGKPENHW
jgi:hypothetical protein